MIITRGYLKKLINNELGRLNISEFKIAKKASCCLVLDNIRSMHNVGSIFRTADAFAVSKIYLTGICPCPPHREIEKSALGATESVDWEYYKNATDLIEKLKNDGWKIASLEQADQSIDLFEFTPAITEKIAFVLGNEVFGVHEDNVNLSDYVIEIPQFGTKHSFNVSVSTGILLWDYYSKINGKVLENPS